MSEQNGAEKDGDDELRAQQCEEGRYCASTAAGSKSFSWGDVIRRFFKGLHLSLSEPETLPEERRRSLPYRPGHNIDVIKEDSSFDEAAAEKEGRDQLPFESRLSTDTSSSSEVIMI